MLKLNPCVPISPPPPDIFQAFTSSGLHVPRVGHFLFAGCPREGDFSDSSITFTKHQWRSQLDGSGHAASPMYMGGGSGGTPPENFEI